MHWFSVEYSFSEWENFLWATPTSIIIPLVSTPDVVEVA